MTTDEKLNFIEGLVKCGRITHDMCFEFVNSAGSSVSASDFRWDDLNNKVTFTYKNFFTGDTNEYSRLTSYISSFITRLYGCVMSELKGAIDRNLF